MKLRLVILAASLVAAWTLPLVASPASADECNGYPIGRCGAFDRETVNFCYTLVAGQMIRATDLHVLAVATSQGAALPDSDAKGAAYLRLAPVETFANDPYESDLPLGSVFQESNNVHGLQLKPFKCGNFIWFAECDSWMGPFAITPTSGFFAADAGVL